MKIGVSLDLASDAVMETAEKGRDRLLHTLMMILSSQTIEVLSSPEGKVLLTKELKEKFTSELSLKEGDIRRVYFSEFVLQ